MSATGESDDTTPPAIAAYDHEDTVVFYDVENPEAWLQIDGQEVWDLEKGDLR